MKTNRLPFFLDLLLGLAAEEGARLLRRAATRLDGEDPERLARMWRVLHGERTLECLDVRRELAVVGAGVEELAEKLTRLKEERDAALTENAAIRLRASDAHAAVYRAMRASPGEALAALRDDGYVHEAVHRVLDGPDGTAEARWDAAAREHLAALGERALRAEEAVDVLRRQLQSVACAQAIGVGDEE